LLLSVKRVYESPGPEDGQRILVDRLWPRGLSKEAAQVDAWVRELSPSTALRQWYGHDRDKWPEFRRRYFAELDLQPELTADLRQRATKGKVTLLYGSKEARWNNAHALREYLEALEGA